MNDVLRLPDRNDVTSMLRSAIGQIEFARAYTHELLDATPTELWHVVPDGLPTSVAWQVGHLTVSQYGLLMFRVRGRDPEDLALIPGRFRKAYGRESTPRPTTAGQPSADELLDRMRRVHETALSELDALARSATAAEVLLEAVDKPYAAYPVKLGAILFCPLHEHTHVGQIGLLRRAHELAPVR